MDSKRGILKSNGKENDTQSESSFYRILFLGDSKVGKTQIINIYNKKPFQEEYFPTFGIDFQIIQLFLNGKNKYIHCIDIDCSPSDILNDIGDDFIRKADAFIFVYDVTSRETLYNLDQFFEKINFCLQNSNNSRIFYLIGNKNDLIMNKFSSGNDAGNLSNKYGARYMEVSAKTRLNIDKMFENIIQDINRRGNNNCSDSGGRIKQNINNVNSINKNENIKKNEIVQEHDSGVIYDTSSYFLQTQNNLNVINNDNNNIINNNNINNNIVEDETNKAQNQNQKKKCYIF